MNRRRSKTLTTSTWWAGCGNMSTGGPIVRRYPGSRSARHRAPRWRGCTHARTRDVDHAVPARRQRCSPPRRQPGYFGGGSTTSACPRPPGSGSSRASPFNHLESAQFYVSALQRKSFRRPATSTTNTSAPACAGSTENVPPPAFRLTISGSSGLRRPRPYSPKPSDHADDQLLGLRGVRLEERRRAGRVAGVAQLFLSIPCRRASRRP